MHISNDRDQENIDRLADQIGEIAFTKDPPLTHREILEFLMGAISGVIFSVICPDCRGASARFVNDVLPRLISSSESARRRAVR
jgi:hypothetical protein